MTMSIAGILAAIGKGGSGEEEEAVKALRGEASMQASISSGSSEVAKLLAAAVEAKSDRIAEELVKHMKPSQLASLDGARGLLKAGLPLAALAYLDRFPEERPQGGSDFSVDDDGNTLLHLACALPSTSYTSCLALIEILMAPAAAGGGGGGGGLLVLDAVNKSEGNTAMHVAAKSGNVEACRALLDGGADPTKRNLKNRTPRSQPKIPDSTKDYLLVAEEEYKKRREEKREALFGSKLQATQTESAFGVRCL